MRFFSYNATHRVSVAQPLYSQCTGTSQANGASDAAGTDAAAGDSSVSTGSSTASPAHSFATGEAVGVAAGVLLVAAVIAAVAAIMWRRRVTPKRGAVLARLNLRGNPLAQDSEVPLLSPAASSIDAAGP